MENKRIGIRQLLQNEMNFAPPGNHSGAGCRSMLKFWEIDPFFKCPVVGICLTLSEQKQILKKAAISSKRKNAFEIHEIMVGSSDAENRLSGQIDRLLNRKFKDEIASLRDLNEKVFMGHWASCFYAGNFAGAFWAAATRADLSDKSRKEIFGSVHMSMHENVKKNDHLKRQLTFHREETVKMIVKMREAARSRKVLQKENIKLRKNQENLRNRLAAGETEIVRMTQEFSSLKAARATGVLERENERLKEALAALIKTVKKKDMLLLDFEGKNRRLSKALEKRREAGASLGKEAAIFSNEAFQANRCDESCPSYDLCQKRVLMVGGLTKMEPLYRQVVEGSNGIFEYHDGYLQKGVKNLESRVRRADMVICPVTCNSHAACTLVKKLGKKHKKPVRLLSGSSLSAIGEALSGKGGVYASKN